MREYYPDFLNFIDEALKLAKKLPRYFSKYSTKYTVIIKSLQSLS